MNVTGLTILNNFTSVYGADAIAAMGIASKVQLVPLQIALGATQRVMPLVSYNYANNNHTCMRDTVAYIGKWVLFFMVLVFVGGALFSNSIISIFISNPQVIHYGSHFLRGLLLVMPFMAIDFLAVSVFQAIGDGKKTLIFAILRKIVFQIPGLIILNYFFKIYGLVHAQVISEVVLAIFSLYFLRDLFRIVSGS